MAALVAQQPWAKSVSFSPSCLLATSRSLNEFQPLSFISSSDGKVSRTTSLGSLKWPRCHLSAPIAFYTRDSRCRSLTLPSVSRGRELLLSFSWRWEEEEDEDEQGGGTGTSDSSEGEEGGVVAKRRGNTFDDGVNLFNEGEYYACHDVLEALWMTAGDPQRGALHGILQCAVGLYHLFNQNHKGAMLEMGEGLTKLRRLRMESGPFHEFDESMGEVLEFLYNTQLEHAACIDEYCLTMDGSEESYKLLGNFGAGQQLYQLYKPDTHEGDSILRIRFNPKGGEDGAVVAPLEVNLPVLRVTSEDLYQRL